MSSGANNFVFLWSAPVAFRRVALETPEWISRDSNHHRQSVSAGKTNAIPTEPSGRPGANNFVGVNLEVDSGLRCEGSLTVQTKAYNPAIVGVVKQMPGCSYAEEHNARREHAVKQWWDLFCFNLQASDGLVDIYRYGVENLDACFALKSPNTLLKRLYAVKLSNQ